MSKNIGTNKVGRGMKELQEALRKSSKTSLEERVKKSKFTGKIKDLNNTEIEILAKAMQNGRIMEALGCYFAAVDNKI